MATTKDRIAEAKAAVPEIDRAGAERLITERNAMILDVRDDDEIRRTGKARSAKAVTRGMLEFRADPSMDGHDPDFDPKRPVVVYCAAGGRAALAGKVLQDMGYSEVYNLGGFKDDWADAGGAVEQV